MLFETEDARYAYTQKYAWRAIARIQIMGCPNLTSWVLM
jgi:hypothetical protein